MKENDIALIYFITSGLVYTVIFTVLMLYFILWRRKAIPVLLLIAIMMINQLLEALCQMLGYLGYQDNVLCTISLIGRTAFTIAAAFWVIFIMKIMYQEKIAPGKYLNLFQYVSRNLLLTYTPSVIISVFLLIVININESDSEGNCWRIPRRKGVLDYVIYLTCFVLPYAIGVFILSIYLFCYVRLPKFSWNLFLVFPICSILFNSYYVAVKLFLLFQEIQSPNIIEIPVMAESLIYAVTFVMLCKTKIKKDVIDDSSITLKDSSVEESFLEN